MIFKWYLCAIQAHNRDFHLILWRNQWKDASCFLQGVSEMRASLKHLFSTFSCTENVPQRPYCTPLEMKNRKKRPHSILSELQYKYRFMHTMKASFPIFWLVSQHCYNALLCIWAITFFFPHMNVKGGKKKDVSCAQS